MTSTPDQSIAERIAAFHDALPYRADTLAVAGLLARELHAHRHALWPWGVPAEVEADGGAWFAGNVSATLTVLVELYRHAEVRDGDPGATEFIARMAWLPELLDGLGDGTARARLDA